MNMFTNCNNLDELKKAYRAAALKHHPDCGGSDEMMKRVNADYEARFNEIKNGVGAAPGQGTATGEAPADFINIINALLKLDDLTIELCGRWLWISGKTKENKDALKAAGCRWCSKKKLWSWHFPEDATRHTKGQDMGSIRSKYGSQIVTGCTAYAALN